MKKYRLQHENRNKRSQEGKQTFSNHKCKVYLVTVRFQKDFNFISVSRNNQLMDRIFIINFFYLFILFEWMMGTLKLEIILRFNSTIVYFNE